MYTEQVVNNSEEYRFEVVSGGQVSVLEYRLGRSTIALVHTEVPEELQGQGIGSSLIKGALAHAREKGLKVLPSCPFVAAYISRHEDEWADIVGEV
jgi:predicted GNAT family acetyltransferase